MNFTAEYAEKRGGNLKAMGGKAFSIKAVKADKINGYIELGAVWEVGKMRVDTSSFQYIKWSDVRFSLVFNLLCVPPRPLRLDSFRRISSLKCEI